jgi:TIR domain
MATAFISYSRKDTDFVRRLYAALEQHGLEGWVDWEGIPPADDWLRKVYAAIESADAFVFVMSPDSLSSVVCADEVAHAVKHNKRLIPVVVREVKPR